MTIKLYIRRRRRIFFQVKGTTFTKNDRKSVEIKPHKKAPPLLAQDFQQGGAFLCGFYFGPPEAEIFQDFDVRMVIFIKEINGFTWYIRKIFPCGANQTC